MAELLDKKAKWQEIANRGLQDNFDPQTRVKFDEAVKRGLITIPAAAQGGLVQQPTQITEQPKPNKTSFGQNLLGVGEAAATFLTGVVAQPVAGLAGLAEAAGAGDLIPSFITGGDEEISSAADRVNQVAQRMTFSPRTEAGRDALSMISVPFEALSKVTRGAGEKVLDATGSPALATTTQVGLESLASLPFLKIGAKTPAGRSREVAAATKAGESIGVDVNAPLTEVRSQVISSAENQTGGAVSRGENIQQVQNAVQRAAADAKVVVDDLYAAARNTNAGIEVGQLKDFRTIVEESLTDFDTQDMPIVQRRLAEISSMSGNTADFSVNMNEIAKFRQRINKNRPAVTDASQGAALNIIKGQLDNFLDAQFNSSMVSGDPKSIARWRSANEAFKVYRDTFSANKVIKQLAGQDANPTEIRSWIYGASSIGARKEASTTVNALKGILGEDSPQFAALRQDALFDIMEPLIREQPNFKAFAANYDRFVKNNKPLNEALFPESISSLDNLRTFAGATENAGSKGFQIDVDKIVTRGLFGNSLARNAAKLSLLGQASRLMRRAVTKSDKQRLMSEVLGYDSTAPLIQKAPVRAQSVVQTGIDQDEQKDN